MKRYQVISTAAAQPGMCLYQDVLDRGGNLMLPKLSVLTAPLIAALERRGVPALHILDGQVSEAQLEQERMRVKERIAHLCRRAGPARANARLRALVEQYRMEQLA